MYVHTCCNLICNRNHFTCLDSKSFFFFYCCDHWKMLVNVHYCLKLREQLMWLRVNCLKYASSLKFVPMLTIVDIATNSSRPYKVLHYFSTESYQWDGNEVSFSVLFWIKGRWEADYGFYPTSERYSDASRYFYNIVWLLFEIEAPL